MELRQLEYFVAVAEERSFTRASQRVHVAQSGLSVSIRSLERELGTPLLARSTRKVELTDAGVAFLPEARATLASADAARNAVSEVLGAVRGTLRIGIMPWAIGDLTRLLGDFREAYPSVRVELRLAAGGAEQLADELTRGELGAAFVATYEARVAGLEVVELGGEPLVLAVPDAHRLAARQTVNISDLGPEPFVDLPAGWGTRSTVDRLFQAAGVARRVDIEVPDPQLLLSFVRQGFGVGFVPRSLLGEPPMAWVRSRPEAVWNLALAFPAGGPPNVVAARFLELVEASLPSMARYVMSLARRSVHAVSKR